MVATMATTKAIDALTRTWRGQRESYPNWLVAPEESRESLWHSLRSMGFGGEAFAEAEHVAASIDIAFLYEFNWRLERCLSPIYGNFLPHYERIVGRYSPYPRLFRVRGSEISPDRAVYSGLDWPALGMQWLDLNLSLLRLYREDAIAEKWEATNACVEALRDRLSPEQCSRWWYERCLRALFALDPTKLRAEIAAWPTNAAMPLWEAKRASLLAELGDCRQAEETLEQALFGIRSFQQLSPLVADLTWVSQESHIMHLLHLVRTSRDWAERRHPPGHRKARQEFRQRWNEL
jgi:hypothetical protein